MSKKSIPQVEKLKKLLEVEKALECVRARSMAMHKSEELEQVIQVVYEQLSLLNVHVEHCGFIIDYPSRDDMLIWLADQNGAPTKVTIPYFDSPHWNSFLEARKKGKDMFVNTLHFKEKNKFYRKLFQYIPDISEEAKEFYIKCRGLAISTVLMDNVGLYMENFSGNPYSEEENLILKRFGQVFQQVYTRFLDLQKAEAQAREAQIEVALERVRSRTMAMQKSEELELVVKELTNQFSILKTEAVTCWIALVNVEANTMELWNNTGRGTSKSNVTVDGKDHYTYQADIEAYKNKEIFRQFSLEKEVAQKVLKKQLQFELENIPEESSEYHWLNCRHNFGFIGYSSWRKADEEGFSLLKRFSKVFEQTYTRFLDLQKAEAQAREAQIEAALERVRSRSLAMQNSNELQDVVKVLRTQLIELGLEIDATQIELLGESDNSIVVWVANEHDPYNRTYNIPHLGHRMLLDCINARNRGKKEFSGTYTKGEKNKYYREAFKKTDLKNLPEKRKKEMLAGTGLGFYAVWAKKTGLHLLNFTGYEYGNEDRSVVKRFSQVFDQVYIRFLDLQKAEAQAREAQIEAALERVRASALAMHTSEDLVKVAGTLREQMSLLGQPQLESAVIELYDLHKDYIESWHTFIPAAKKDGKKLSGKELFRKDACAFLKDLVQMYQSPEKEYTIVSKGKKQKDFVKILSAQIPEVAKVKMADLMYYTCSDFTGGTLLVGTLEEPSNETKELLSRASRVFDLAYKRFLDLKKAEEQTREAQIESVLERARASTMAMHNSYELEQVALTFLEQLEILGIKTQWVNLLLHNPIEDSWQLWLGYSNNYEIKKIRGKSFTLDLPQVDDDPTLEAWRSGEKVHITRISSKELGPWIAKYKTIFEITGQDVKEVKSLYKDGFYRVDAFMKYGLFGAGAIGSFTDEEVDIQCRLAREFERTYQRFLDLKKAETQAREAQIEAALERVRASSMAMHESKELADVSAVLYNELKSLGISSFTTCGYVIIDEKNKVQHAWTAATNLRLLEYFELPLLGDRVFKQRYDAWKKKEPIFYHELNRDQMVKHMEVAMRRATSTEKATTRKLVMPDKNYFYYGNFSNGYLQIIGGEKLPEDTLALLPRFAKVFEQAYTRFLDLKKAEAQAREAQIEAALERVRAASMAMHRSEDLVEVATVLHNELRSLNVREFSETSIVVHDEPSRELVVWGARTGAGSLEKSVFPLLGDPILQKLYDTWLQQEDFFTLKVEGAALRNHVDFVFPKASRTVLENEAIKSMPDPTFFHCAFFCMGYLELMADKELSEDSSSLLVRFAKVFDQAYRRFLDLKKAEAQAREAQIEAALERIRARALAMHSSEELYEVARVLREQMGVLGQPDLEASVVHLYPEDSETFESWYAMRPPGRNKGKIITGVAHFPIKSSAVASETVKAYHAKPKEYTLRYRGAKLKEWMGELAKQAPEISKSFKGKPPKQHIYHFSDFSGGSLLMVSQDDPTEVAKDLQRRAASVFDLAYRRFLDLRQAEEQAREAQIEAALERVRSTAMAMHNSEELQDVVAVVFEKLMELGFELEKGAAIILTFIKGSKDHFEWIADPTQTYVQRIGFPYYENPLVADIINGWKKGTDYYSREYSSKVKNDFFRYAFEHTDYKYIPDPRKKTLLKAEKYSYSIAFEKNSAIGVPDATGKLFSKEKKDILKRFAHVFEQAYTRFLDLQKAEAQAREAQIETALERVRAASMAMHASTDLGGVAKVMFDQLDELGIETIRMGILIFHENKTMDAWGAMASREGKGNTIQIIGAIENKGHPILEGAYNTWKQKKKHFRHKLKGNDLKQYYKTLGKSSFKVPSIKDMPAKQVLDQFHFSEGAIYSFTKEELDPASFHIFERFSNAFGQAYRRYLDIKRAEAQAREAQIEVALERVRAASLAMHQSDELKKVVAVMYEQLESLKLSRIGCEIILCDEKNDHLQFWSSSIKQSQLPERYNIPRKIHPFFKKIWSAWKQQQPRLAITLAGKEKRDFDKLIFSKTDFKKFPDKVKKYIRSRKSDVFTFASMKYGVLEAVDDESLPEDKIRILERFAKVFEQTYTRFLDLQKAETQAREAQIEASLERVRASSMAMHTTEELWEVSSVVYAELNKLGITDFESCGFHIVDEEKQIQEVYNFHIDSNQLTRFQAPLKGDKILNERYKAWKQQDKIIYQKVGGKALNDHLEYVSAQGMELGSSSSWTEKFGFPDPVHFHFGNFSRGYLHIIAAKELTEEHKSILVRFARVFEQAYIRFLDLQKAEAQAREAQIEAAMERIRSRALAMRDSNEIMDVITELRRQIDSLGQLDLEASVVHLYPPGEPMFESIAAVRPPGESGEIVLANVFFPVDATDRIKYMIEMYESDQTEYTVEFNKEMAEEWQEVMIKYAPMIAERRVGFVDNRRLSDRSEYWNFADFSEGSLLLVTHSPASNDTKEVLRKASQVFDLAYRRYRDLQKAEARTREAQIEAALERVRARALAMHSSKEITDVVQVLREQMGELNQPELSGCVIHVYKDNSETFESWFAFRPYKQKKVVSGSAKFPVEATSLTKKWLEYYHSKKSEYTIESSGMEYQEWVKLRNGTIGSTFFKAVSNVKTNYYHCSDFSGGTLITSSSLPPSAEVMDLQRRAAAVFDLAYRRFHDLQSAESREKEAIKEASLDRVRAEIASMRTTDDLNRITPLVWRELTTLGVPFFRCGVFIVDEDVNKINVYLSNPKGESLAAWQSDYDTTPLFRATYEHWKKQQIYRTEWDKEQFIEFGEALVQQGLISDTGRYQAGKEAPDYLALQMVPFKQGMLYVGSSLKLSEEQIALAESLADAFSVAYARYDDFKQLDQAKSRIENTLVELKAAQNQLIHSEKMASLGELTAGIAHEIQNPLNFVNNFSDINKELADEVLEEIRNGNIAEAEALISDIINNDRKILHHGKRAEEIVRSMLLHSRGSSGERDMTDINSLADEYMRLAYHGMRAKDKSFNTDFKLELDKSLPRIKVIQQDIGRVLLNLINNAFYATNELKNNGDGNYKPEVLLSTRALKNAVEIRVKDNGGGIPEKVLEKIFQPFFTTKPTGQGTGLGLSLSYDIITKGHGGKLEVKTKEGKGSEFIIWLPI